LTPDYLRLIDKVEALPQNQAGADKSWVWRADRAFLATYADVRPVLRDP